MFLSSNAKAKLVAYNYLPKLYCHNENSKEDVWEGYPKTNTIQSESVYGQVKFGILLGVWCRYKA